MMMASTLVKRSAALSSQAGVASMVAEHVGAVRGFAAKKKAAKKGKKGGEDANFELMLRTVRGRYPDAEPFTEEEQQRFQEIGRRFNAMTSVRHNHFMRDLQTKIDLKWEAINALPVELQAEALEEDDAAIPEERGFPTWTPPIEGFYRYTGDGEVEE
ncbi:hypothetical protein Poli38472_006604 [Pythium oligandrum]|uniref:Uncharacterized protein n=1 Tax=Pythium oligandrum TaxID=41045 RepID=A0A8K1FD77_PYTOL|nr:hypothetical protein Poli38472_006604 [Pythium oligandrum]|eukprot:TMW56594.1 hypothetical protein Poli38472_006604 [Pythium oligandrum]